MGHVWDDIGYDEWRRDICRRSQKKRREAAVKNGLCIVCCKVKVEKGYKSCPECRKRISAAAKRKRENEK